VVAPEAPERVLVPPSTSPDREEPKPPEPARYIVKPGDNLSKIADEQKTTWPRLWNKNTDLKDPDIIQIGQVLIIPLESEVLEDRPVPVPEIPVFNAERGLAAVPRGSVSGNNYSPGYCTWYVKNRRPDLPNNLGNANTWQSRAASMGLPTGSTPRAGAVGTTTAGDLGHVVYVESVNGDGTITISEMNYRGLYNMNTRTVSASSFLYIY
jgi:LysM repeat protein